MSATDDLRRMLDERGVEWDYGITGATTTRFSVNGIDLTFTPMRDGLVCSTILTPAQVIAATLGPSADELNVMMGTGTCKADETDLIPFVRADGDVSEVDYIRVMECSSCGGTFEHINGSYEFCPRCGRRIEVDE